MESSEQVCILVAYDRNSALLSKKAGFGRITALEIDSTMGYLLSGAPSLCTDEATNYRKFAEMKGLEHYTVNAHKKE